MSYLSSLDDDYFVLNLNDCHLILRVQSEYVMSITNLCQHDRTTSIPLQVHTHGREKLQYKCSQHYPGFQITLNWASKLQFQVQHHVPIQNTWLAVFGDFILSICIFKFLNNIHKTA